MTDSIARIRAGRMIPPRRILAGVDFSAGSRDALAGAARLARLCGADLHVVHVVDPRLASAAAQSGIDLADEATRELTSFACAVVAHAADPPRFHVVRGESAAAIEDVADREEADLIVVGKHGLGGDERHTFGATVEGLLRRARRSVLVVPSGWTPDPSERLTPERIGPIVVGVDLTEPSLEAAAAGARLAATLRSETVLVHVVSPLATLARWHGPAEAAVRVRECESKRDLELILPTIAAVAPASLQIHVGAIAQTLVQAAVTRAGAILVLGRQNRPHEYGPPGAIAYRALTLSDVPILVYVRAL